MDDLISRQAAIDALGEEPEVWSENDQYELGLNNQWNSDVIALKALPSAVVRCKECKWRDEHSLICANDDIARRIDDCGCYPDFMPDPDWFCAYGERKDDAEIH